MVHAFDPGYIAEPFVTLCKQYPDSLVYPLTQFRVEWGPIFHRGRLDGSARILVIGQDPAQHETVVRRILVGEAGRRVQGLLAKLGVTRSYVFINAFLYSVYGSVRAKTRQNPELIDYRNQWIDALVSGGQIEAVIALGRAADEAWKFWKQTSFGADTNIAYAAITHPTQPESSSKRGKVKLAAATKKMLQNWNVALQSLAPEVKHPDLLTPLILYGDSWNDGDRTAIPEFDFPAGLPGWMHEQDSWAKRSGADDLSKRRNITITVPKGVLI
ncbi:MAG: uracil-DNA glycosylase [Gammaproteobacteria bacterium]|nr:uracil-DNA glycosylase [Gammaproteobacteria bacterium]